MNKKQFEGIIHKYVTFQIHTDEYISRDINSDMVDFLADGLICIHEHKDIIIHLKDIKRIDGVRI